MKKMFLVTTILLSMLTCYGNEPTGTTEQMEINLETNTPKKTYKIERPTPINNPDNNQYNYDDDEDSLFNINSTPFQLLKQYQQYQQNY